MRVLVTGHKGYIGTCLVNLLLQEGFEVSGLDSDLFRECTFEGALARIPEVIKDVRDVTPRDVEGYDAVIHLRTPSTERRYNHANPLRTESAARAVEVDALVLEAWDGHPRRWLVESSADFLDKAARALGILRGELPACCREHEIPCLRDRPHQQAARARHP